MTTTTVSLLQPHSVLAFPARCCHPGLSVALLNSPLQSTKALANVLCKPQLLVAVEYLLLSVWDFVYVILSKKLPCTLFEYFISGLAQSSIFERMVKIHNFILITSTKQRTLDFSQESQRRKRRNSFFPPKLHMGGNNMFLKCLRL